MLQLHRQEILGGLRFDIQAIFIGGLPSELKPYTLGAIMQLFTFTERTNEAGSKVYAVTYQGCQALMADTTDKDKALQYAEKLFEQAQGKTVLRHWNGDSGTDTFLKDKI